jgi:phage terminase large subunit-like protein
MNEELRQYLRTKCFESLYFFCKFVLGFADLTPTFHGQICAYVQRRRRHKLIVMPRGHLKTSICTIAYSLWRVTQNPELRVLIANATATNAEHFVRMIRAIVDANEMYRWLFPEVLPGPTSKWTDKELCFTRRGSYPESTIESIGVGGTVTSRHYDITIEDDLLAPEDNQEVTAEQVQTAIRWHKYASSLLISPQVSEQVITGTRWLYDDFISYIFENESWFLPCLYSSSYNPATAQPWWPERFPQEALDRIMDQQGPKIYSCQYMNDPVLEDARSFDPAWRRFYTAFPPIDSAGRTVPYKCVLAIDPAFGQKKKNDYTGLVVVATDIERNRYVVEAKQGRWGVDELISNVFELHRRWQPVMVGLEAVLAQQILIYPFKEAMRRESYTFHITALKGGFVQRRKEFRIQSLHEFFANGSMWINRQHTDFIKQLNGWPAVQNDDILDALAYAMQMLVYPTQAQSFTFQSNLSFEYIKRELKSKPHSGQSVFSWPLSGRPAPVIGRTGLPQSEQEVWDLIQESKAGR